MIDETEHTCQFCYYEYFDSRAYPCSMCVCGEERKDMFMPKGRQNKRKTEPNLSEKSTSSTISKMEQVDKDINVRSKDEPQTELVRVKYHCINCAENGSYKCSKCDGEMYYKYDKDEPQTCEECEHWSDTDDGCADRHGCTITDCAWK